MKSAVPTVVTILTPPGRGAVAVISIEGPSALDFVQRFFLPNTPRPLPARQIGAIVYGRWADASGEDVIVCRRSAERIEVHCHGGNAASARIFADLVQAGATETSWQDWIAKNEPSRIRAAARIALARCSTQKTAAILLDQYNGALEREIRTILERMQHPHPDPLPKGVGEKSESAIEKLLARAWLGLHLTQPWRVVIAGPPNVGKSSLINALLGYERAIVFDQPGTTRDVVTASTALDGWPVELADTAGMRATSDEIESAGVERAMRQVREADCIVLVFDGSLPWTAENQELLASWPGALIVHNKCDLPTIDAHKPDGLRTSATTDSGIDELARAIVRRLVPVEVKPGEGVPFTGEQVEQLQLALEAIRGGDLSTARKGLHAMLA